MEQGKYFSVILEQEALSRVLSNLIGVSTRRSTMAYLSQVRICFSGTSVEFTTTDNELSLTESILEVNGASDAVILVDVFRLHEIVKRLPSDIEATFSIEKANFVIRSKGMEFSLPYLDEQHFPLISEEEKRGQIEFLKGEIKELFNKVKFAISNEATRHHLNGIYLESDGEKITVAATDVHRLAVATLIKKTDLKFSCIIPRKTVLEIIKLSVLGESVLFLHGKEYVSRIRMSFGGVFLNSKLIAGTFPNFAAVIPKDFRFSLVFDRKSFAKSIERVGIVSPDQSRAINFGINGKQLQLSASSSDSSFGRESLTLDEEFKEEISIYLNHAYVLDVLSVLESEKVTMSFNDATSQILFQGDEDALYVVMPMAL